MRGERGRECAREQKIEEGFFTARRGIPEDEENARAAPFRMTTFSPRSQEKPQVSRDFLFYDVR
jgi:hypothetical protein